jgi:hypothetical protein
LPVPADAPPDLPALAARALVAFTIEFDNEFEHQMPHTTTRGPAARSGRGPWLVSMAMWENFLRDLDSGGRPLRELRARAELVNLAGLERWRYVTVAPDPADERDAPPRGDWLVRPTRAGRAAQRIWRPLAAAIEDRWRERWGPALVAELRSALLAVVAEAGPGLPRYLPVAGVTRYAPERWPDAATRDPAADAELASLLSRLLLAFALDFERESRLSLAVSANVLRELSADGVRLRDLPLRAGISREAAQGSVKFLDRHGCLAVEAGAGSGAARVARLTARGERAQDKYRRVLAATQQAWAGRYGAAPVGEVTRVLERVVTAQDGGEYLLARGLTPYPDGWRAHPPYRAQTAAVLGDPLAALPWYPMVSHRGGFPDGS